MPISPKQERILNYIKGYIVGSGAAPTMKEIGAHFEMRSSASVSANLDALEREGLIKRTPNVSRGIEIVQREQDSALTRMT